MKKFLRILKYIGIGILFILTLFILLVVFSYDKNSYKGSINHGTNEWCYYGYNPNIKECCDEDDYSCEMIDLGATAECNDGSFSFSSNYRGTCSKHDGVNVWFK